MKVTAERIAEISALKATPKLRYRELERAGFSLLHYNCEPNNPAGGPS